MKPLPLLFVSLLLLAGILRAEESFGVDRTELLTDLAPNATRTLRFTVNNPGTEALPFTVYAEDFGIADGAPVFGQAAGPRALAGKLTVFPASFELKPGESREVAVTLDPGPGPFQRGSYYAAIFVQSSKLTESAAGAERGSRIVVARRLGLYFVADFEPEAKPLPGDVTITSLALAPGGVTLRVKNPSPYMRFVTGGSLQLTALSGGAPHAIPLRRFRLLPDTETTVETPVPAKWKLGEANVLAVVDYGAEELLVGEQRLKF
jgi:P pilus assembly chaperone PapD